MLIRGSLRLTQHASNNTYFLSMKVIDLHVFYDRTLAYAVFEKRREGEYELDD